MIRSIFFKSLLLITIFSTYAHAGLSVAEGGQSRGLLNPQLKKLGRLLESKSLECKPLDRKKPTDSRYRGDEGYFSLAVKEKSQDLELVVSDNGDSGYGFSSGEFLDLAFAGSRFYLSVGDDGFQTLVFDFDDLGASGRLTKNCAQGVLLDAADFTYHAGSSIDLVCCLK